MNCGLQSELGFSVDKVANDVVITVKRKSLVKLFGSSSDQRQTCS